ncbi:MAG: transposase [Dyadobacter sp.]|uniref:transposase n=1 Tax=Dyadobacter sp. TaxID=1914288 RepID=UPI003265A447
MKDTATDYKLLYEQAIAEHKKSLELISEKDEQIQALNFELDKYKRYIFGKKNEKLAGIHTDVNQINLFKLGTDQTQQEELSLLPDQLRIMTKLLSIILTTRSTNASAESFNAKIKFFRSSSRGMRDISFFLFRLSKIYA